MLGPQSSVRTVPDVVRDFGLTGADVATVTAGWEERERDDADLDQDLGGKSRNLALFPRAEDVFRHDKELRRAMYRRYDQMNEQAAFYRAQLAPLMATLRELEQRIAAGDAHLEPERENCVRLVTQLDEHRMRRVDEFDAEVFVALRLAERRDIARHRTEIARILDGVGALLVAGGHVGILLNRLRLFGVLELARDLPVIAWSGGAMVMTERVVLFHDRPPVGEGNPEVHVRGLGLARGVVALPNASRRLDLSDHARLGAFSARFSGVPCLALDPGAWVAGDVAHPVAEWRDSHAVVELTSGGPRAWGSA